jgi:DnaK suppressor protein
MSKRAQKKSSKGAPSKKAAKKPAVKAVARPKRVSAPKAVAAPKAKAKTKTKAVGKARDKTLTVRATTSSIVLAPDYRPSEDEPFMNERHRAYFRQKLLSWKEEIIRQTKETLAGLHEDSTQHADLADRATSETDRNLELRARDRQRKLIAKIDAALARIEDGTYGYCEETGEPIGLKRLDARPIATLSVEAQERHERRERVYRED